jgi:cation transport regulator ChaC
MRKLDDKYSRFKTNVFDHLATNSREIFVFAYGSLMNPNSIRKSIRLTHESSTKTACLYGYARGWFSQSEVVLQGNEEKGHVPAAFLGLKRQHEAYCNGILVPVSNADLRTLDLREKGYVRVEVSPLVFPSVEGQIFAYVVQDQSPPPEWSLVLRDYVRVIEEALEHYGVQFKDEFHLTTVGHHFKESEQGYRFYDSEQNIASGR